MSGFKVDFIGVGAPRCATTWVSRCLAAHPRISFSSIKETHFFDKIYRSGKDLSLYATYFSKDTGRVRGEFTPGYYLDEKIASTIKELFPEVKIIICLRDPAERAFSHYLYSKRKGTGSFRNKTFSEIIEKNNPLIKRGFYYFYLSRFLSCFDRSKVLVLLYDDIKKNPKGVLEKLYGFLDVDSGFVPKRLTERPNAAKDIGYKYHFINRFIFKARRTLARVPGNKDIRRLLRATGIRNAVNFVLKKNSVKKAYASVCDPDPVLMDKLKKMYREDITCLEKFLELDLRSWY